MDIILSLIFIVFGILQIVLFFKMWGMTNDVRIIRDKLLSHNNVVPDKQENAKDLYGFQVGSHVVEKKSEKQFSIIAINEDGTYTCSSNHGITSEIFSADDIELFSEFQKRIKVM